MTNAKPRRSLFAGAFAALLAALVVIPGAISVASGDGAICVSHSSCPASAINPCVRHPSFAVVGRCALAIH